MQHMMKIVRSLLCALIMSVSTSYAMNMTRPWEPYVKPIWDSPLADARGFFAAYGEKGFDAQGFNGLGNCVNVLQVWNADQDALAMLLGFPADSPIGRLRVLIGGNDNGVRGHFDVCGNLTYAGAGVSLAGALPYDFYVGFYLPIYTMRLDNVSWINKTLDLTADDARVKTYLTNDFFANVCELGGLNLQGWKRTGFGDSALIVDWVHDFIQYKPMLKNVRLNARCGLTLPTGLRQDEDKIFALPFGNDGSAGILWGGSLIITLGDYVKAGLDVELLHLFGNTKMRRIKTNVNQTELLLLQKVCAYKEWGFTQQFLLNVQLYHLIGGFSCAAYYEYIKRGESSLSLLSYQFSANTANSARSLDEWMNHSMIVKAQYDIGVHMADDAAAYPSLYVYAKVPVDGTNAALNRVFAAGIQVEF